jgi:plastocyanin
MKRTLVIAALFLMVPIPSRAATEHQMVALNTTYRYVGGTASPTVTITQGDSLVFTNLDAVYAYNAQVYPQQHNVVDDAYIPRFGTGLVQFGQRAVVSGVRNLPPGRYPFHCSRHSYAMRGTLIVNAA